MLRLWKETVLSPHDFQSRVISVPLVVFFSSPIFLQKNHPQCCSLLEVPNTNIEEWPPERLHKWVIIQDLPLQPSDSCWQDKEHLCFISFHWRSCKSFLVSMKDSEYNVSLTPQISGSINTYSKLENGKGGGVAKFFGSWEIISAKPFWEFMCDDFWSEKASRPAYLHGSDAY